MRYMMLGQTGLEVSKVGFGGIPIIRLSTAEAVTVLRRAYERGITLFDTANMYLDSEEKMGLAFDGIRSRMTLATKTLSRDRAGAEQGVMIASAMSYPIIARRLSEIKAAKFSAKIMDSVRNCTECGECMKRCPYNLPIPELLKKHLALYEQHAAGG